MGKQKNILLYTFIFVFIATMIVTLLGITKLITIDKEYLDKLFYALLIEAALPVITLFKKTKFFDNDSKTEVLEEKVYSLSDSISFYNAIYDVYDEENSKELIETHRNVIKAINKQILDIENPSILDIGGGTGHTITDLFVDNKIIKWHYLEPSFGMYNTFKEDFKTSNLKIIRYKNDLSNFDYENHENSFDIIVMCFLLSSVNNLPNFKIIKSLLKENGTLIIADANPDYSKDRPYSIVKNNTKYTLKICPRNPIKMNNLIIDDGFEYMYSNYIKKRGLEYSYISIFKKTKNKAQHFV
uniref:class I SAM-dependent methyltransferase n=1 Tax=uncultured Draconibacterium sp. TaxID=1573823 RepID=UPI0032168C66